MSSGQEDHVLDILEEKAPGVVDVSVFILFLFSEFYNIVIRIIIPPCLVANIIYHCFIFHHLYFQDRLTEMGNCVNNHGMYFDTNSNNCESCSACTEGSCLLECKEYFERTQLQLQTYILYVSFDNFSAYSYIEKRIFSSNLL